MRTFWLCLAVLLGSTMMFVAGAGAAAGYLAFSWPSNWGKTNEAFHNGYASGVMDTVTYIHQVGVSGATLSAAHACVGTKGLTDGIAVKAVEALLASNPKFEDTMAGAFVATLQTCKITVPAGNAQGNTMVKR